MHAHIVQVRDKYDLPTKNVLVLGCIDLRLTDETMAFLHHDNLQNRFDYFTLAGAALTTAASKYPKDFNHDAIKPFGNFLHWRRTFNEHVASAIALHQIQDIYIIEHRNCGAYKLFLNNGNFKKSAEDEEKKAHKKYATALAKDLEQLKTKFLENGKIKTSKLKVHAFLIDLRGDVDLLYPDVS